MKRILISIVTLALFTGILSAQDLISAEELAQKMKKDKNCVVISAVKEKIYKSKVHIKGSINIPYKALERKDAPVKGLLKSPAQLAKLFGDNGVSEKNFIVVYDNGKGKYAGRLYWTLKYLGCENVKVLDGGLKAWKAARKPYTKAIKRLKKTVFTPHVKKEYLATIDDVKSGKYLLVDVRSPEEYKGIEGKTERKGHIPGAVNFHYKKVLAPNGKMKSKTALLSLFKEAGITKDKKIILYCATSVRAGIVWLALHSILNYPDVKVYDGAFNEWVSDPANKVEK